MSGGPFAGEVNAATDAAESFVVALLGLFASPDAPSSAVLAALVAIAVAAADCSGFCCELSFGVAIAATAALVGAMGPDAAELGDVASERDAAEVVNGLAAAVEAAGVASGVKAPGVATLEVAPADVVAAELVEVFPLRPGLAATRDGARSVVPEIELTGLSTTIGCVAIVLRAPALAAAASAASLGPAALVGRASGASALVAEALVASAGLTFAAVAAPASAEVEFDWALAEAVDSLPVEGLPAC